MSPSSKMPLFDIARLFSPFDNIDADLLALLVKDIKVKAATEGFTLFNADEVDSEEYYLLSGKIALQAKDGRDSVIEAGDKARFPIARLRPRMFTAKAASDIKYFTMDRSVIDELQRSVTKDNNHVAIQEMQHRAGKEGHALLHEFQQELNNGRFVLPSLPEVAFRIRELIEDQDCNLGDLVKLVNTDPAIATKLVKVANSPIYRGVNHCDDTQAAITRLGLVTTKQLVTSFAVLALFNSKSSMFKEHMTTLWKQSVEVAAYSYVLANHLPTFSPEEAMLAGLIHAIGEIVVLTYAERFYDLATNESNLSMVIASLRGPIGEMVLQKWDFAEDLVTVARESNQWQRDSGEQFDYCDLVQIATLYASQSGENSGSMPDMSSVPAFQKLAQRQIDSEHTAQIIHEAQDQIAELRALFN